MDAFSSIDAMLADVDMHDRHEREAWSVEDEQAAEREARAALIWEQYI